MNIIDSVSNVVLLYFQPDFFWNEVNVHLSKRESDTTPLVPGLIPGDRDPRLTTNSNRWGYRIPPDKWKRVRGKGVDCAPNPEGVRSLPSHSITSSFAKHCNFTICLPSQTERDHTFPVLIHSQSVLYSFNTSYVHITETMDFRHTVRYFWWHSCKRHSPMKWRFTE